MQNIIVLQPQFLIDALNKVIFDDKLHRYPEFDEALNCHFRTFLTGRVLSTELLQSIWDCAKYDNELQDFFTTLLKSSSLMCDYKFGTQKAYVVPCLFNSTRSLKTKKVYKRLTSQLSPVDESASDAYRGPFFVIDFSGDYITDISCENYNENHVRFLPFGKFERLVCLCVDFSH